MTQTTSFDWGSPWPAPAKLNLFLHVVGRRDDGYHLLQTVFRLIDRTDTLRFFPRDDGQIRLLNPISGVPPEQDLCYRAADLLRQHMGQPMLGADIALDKKLPMGGGLGGGSSDAATVLLALNHLWQLKLDRSYLAQIGLRLGADVPIFIFGKNAFAEGVGEKLQALDLPAALYLVIEPGVSVPTASIFKSPNLCRNTPFIAPNAWQLGQGHNDLEPVARELFPAVGEALDWLQQFGDARMSGSGACVFVAFADVNQANAALAQCPPQWRAWLAHGLPKHPLESLA